MWKAVKNYEGYYEVSDNGIVRSLNRFVPDTKGEKAGRERLLRGITMKQTISKGRDNDGYYVVNIHKNGISDVCLVHVLVAQAFLPNPDHLPTVNHIDGNKRNNEVSNLEWASFSENNIHALRTWLRSPRGNAIAQFTIDGEYVASYRSTCEAVRETGLSRGSISHCLNGRTKTACGYVWKKLSESQTTIPQGSTQEDELPAEAQRPLTERKI